MTCRPLLAAVLLLTICSAQERKQYRSMSAAEMFPFHGPIHSQTTITRQLEKDPRLQPTLQIRTPQGWVVFDQSGRITEEGNLDGDGKISFLVRLSYNADGEQSSSVVIDGRKTTRIRTEKNAAADGSAETKTFANDKLQSTVLSKADASRASD